MLEQILRYLNNWFVADVQQGEFTVEGNYILLPFLQDGQWFRIVGSVFNDGVYRYTADLHLPADEVFSGAIWALAVPSAVAEVADEVTAWQARYSETLDSPYSSESFSGSSYSYTKKSGDEAEVTWETKFAARLAPYRKARDVSAVQPRQTSPGFHRPFNPGQPYGV